MSLSRIYHSLHLDISTFKSDRICYIILPEKLKEEEKPWLDQMAKNCNSNMVVVSGLDWENSLTPWKTNGIKSGTFGGRAEDFLKDLTSDLFVNQEISMGINNAQRHIVGVSLSGLFAVWASIKKNLFKAVGSVSGSFWYDGFMEWFDQQDISQCPYYYFSLGEQEKYGKNARLATVEEQTEILVSKLRGMGKIVFFEYNEGNHFGPLIQRIEKAILNLFNSDNIL